MHKLYCSTASVEPIDETVGTRSFNTGKKMETISSLERSYDFDFKESFKSCLANVSFLYTKQFNRSTASPCQVERIDETGGTH